MKKLAWMLALTMAFCTLVPFAMAEGTDERFVVNVAVPDDYEGELNGRLLFMFDDMSLEDGAQVFDNLDVTGCPVFGKTVYGLKAGDVITMTEDDPEVYGYPMQLADVPDGEYAVQALFVKYTQFNRADGTSIWGMADHGGGGSVADNPYNLYSTAQMATVGSGTLNLTLDNEIELGYELKDGMVTQQGNYEDTDMVKYVKIKSEALSDFWGCDMYVGANVLLPKNYDPSKKYPVLYYQGHWPAGNAPLNYGKTGKESWEAFNEYWDNEAPNMIVVTVRDANMYYDTSYSVNSANLGPWGDAIVGELVPYIEEKFNAVGEPWARALAGGSTGGWESMALQVFYPDFFGGTWPLCPDGLDFHAHQIVNIYDDDNAYYQDKGWVKTERPASRDTKGNIRWTMAQENHWEIAMGGLNGVSLGQWAIWQAVYGPVNEDGYPAHIWDPITGEIDKEVAAYWQEHFDICHYLQENWKEIGPSLVGKIHLRGGDMDNYYLNLGQNLVADFLEAQTEPAYEGYSKTFPNMGHTGNITHQELLEEIAAHMIKYGPENAAEILGK